MNLSDTDFEIIDNLTRKQLILILEEARGEKCDASEDTEDLRTCLRADLVDGKYAVDLAAYGRQSSSK